jgi:protein gp37
MGATTEISWTDSSFNPWIGCTKVSHGCKNCYAEVSTPARTSKAKGLPLWGVDAHRQRTSAANWKLPLKWDRDAAKAGVRRRVFCASLADIFEDREDLDVIRADLFDLIRRTPNLDWQILTKRPEAVLRILRRVGIATDSVDVARMMAQWCGGDPPVNVWLGTSVEDQEMADARVSHLVNIHAVVRFLSMEPLLGPVDLERWLTTHRKVTDADADAPDGATVDGMTRSGNDWHRVAGIHWIIVGGESGPGARPFNVAWPRDIIAQCRRAGVAPFVKQMGAYVVGAVHERSEEFGYPGDDGAPLDGLDDWGRWRLKLSDRKGGELDEFPSDLRVREFPDVR